MISYRQVIIIKDVSFIYHIISYFQCPSHEIGLGGTSLMKKAFDRINSTEICQVDFL